MTFNFKQLAALCTVAITLLLGACAQTASVQSPNDQKIGQSSAKPFAAVEAPKPTPFVVSGAPAASTAERPSLANPVAAALVHDGLAKSRRQIPLQPGEHRHDTGAAQGVSELHLQHAHQLPDEAPVLI